MRKPAMMITFRSTASNDVLMFEIMERAPAEGAPVVWGV
jgi:hypothetical protein